MALQGAGKKELSWSRSEGGKSKKCDDDAMSEGRNLVTHRNQNSIFHVRLPASSNTINAMR